MGMVYFKSNNTIVTMDGETSIDVSRSNTVSSSSVMSTRTASDELIQGNLVISVTGNITYSKTTSQEGNPTPEEWVDLIEDAISNKERFTLYSVKYQNGNPLLKNYNNMVIQSYGYIVDRFENTITARIVFREIFVSSSASVTELAALTPVRSEETKTSLNNPTTDGKGTSTSQDKVLALKLFDFLTTDEGEN